MINAWTAIRHWLAKMKEMKESIASLEPEPSFQIEWVGSPNFTKGRKGKKPIAIVNHITDGNFPGCLEWLQNPLAKASAHFIVTKTGRILQLVLLIDTAWANGDVKKPKWKLYDGYTNPNRVTISIEHEGFPNKPLSDKQYQASLWLHKYLLEACSIKIDTNHIIGHCQINTVTRPNCPGPKFPWDRLFCDLTRWQAQKKEAPGAG